jgi:hypothetical protein
MRKLGVRSEAARTVRVHQFRMSNNRSVATMLSHFRASVEIAMAQPGQGEAGVEAGRNQILPEHRFRSGMGTIQQTFEDP